MLAIGCIVQVLAFGLLLARMRRLECELALRDRTIREFVSDPRAEREVSQ